VQKVIDLGGRLLCPGMIDIQLNGALGFDFSTVPDTDEGMPAYAATYADVCRGWIKTGVTSFLPTVVTNPSNAFQKVRNHQKLVSNTT
jgi:N-acetylglucosamine-6-phosphate deacetylase